MYRSGSYSTKSNWQRLEDWEKWSWGTLSTTLDEWSASTSGYSWFSGL